MAKHIFSLLRQGSNGIVTEEDRAKQRGKPKLGGSWKITVKNMENSRGNMGKSTVNAGV